MAPRPTTEQGWVKDENGMVSSVDRGALEQVRALRRSAIEARDRDARLSRLEADVLSIKRAIGIDG